MIIKEILSPSGNYKAQVIKRPDGLFSTEVCMWEEDCGYEFWGPIKSGLTLVDTEQNAIKIAIEQLREHSGETIET